MRLFSVLALSVVMNHGSFLHAQDMTPFAGWDNHLYPAYLLSTSGMEVAAEDVAADATTLGDVAGLLGVELTATVNKQPVTVTISADQIMEPATWTGTLPQKGETYRINPDVTWRHDLLGTLTKPVTVKIAYTVTMGAKPVHTVVPVMLHSVNECPYSVTIDGEAIDISYTLASYVNEDHPALDALLVDAVARGRVKEFTGYTSGDDGEVIRQVYAVWDTLVARKLSCVAMPPAAKKSSVQTQLVRSLDQSIGAKQLTSVDGSLLLASALKKIGIEPFIVMVPGHVYVGFYVEQNQESLLAIETTVLGTNAGRDGSAPSFESLDESVSKELRDPASWPSFAVAVVQATNAIEQHAEKFSSPDEPDYLMIDIAEARAMGVTPILTPVAASNARPRTSIAGEPPARQ